MKQFMKRALLTLLVLTMLLSCVGTAFAAQTPTSVQDAERAELTSQGDTSLSTKRIEADGLEKQSGVELKGFLSEQFRQANAYRYANDETVRAIVLLDGKPEADVAVRGTSQAAAQRKALTAQHLTVREAMSGIKYTLVYDFTALINGFSCDVVYGDLEKIAAIDGVASVHIANRYSAPVVKAADRMPNAGTLTGNTATQNSGYAGQGTVIAVLDTGLRVTHEAFQDADGKMAQTGRLTEDDLALAAASGAYVNAKIPFAYDYADRDNDVSDVSGHGTHVAGIAAGNTYDADEGAYTFLGAAPYAQILAMKIFPDAEEYTSSDIYFFALEDAYRLGADVINMSIGAQGGFTYDDTLETEVFGNIYARLTKSGIIVSAAAGNEYSMAEFSSMGYIGAEYPDFGVVGSPSSYDGNLSVASVENVAYPAYVVTVDGKNFAFTDSSAGAEDPIGLWRAAFGGQTVPFAVVPDGKGGIALGAPEDYAGLDVTGKVAVVLRGTLNFEEKVENAANAGAIGCIVVNNQPGSLSMSIETFEVPAILVDQTAAEVFLNAQTETLHTSAEPVTAENPIGMQMSDFSNWGPTPMLTIDPTITSVGGRVYSTYNTGDDDYEVLDGTSMAAPNASGTFANVLSFLMQTTDLSKAERAERAKAMLESSAVLISDLDDYLYAVRKQGAGLANSDLAINAYNEVGYITDPIQELGDDAAKLGFYVFSVTLRNEGTKDAHYANFETYILTDYIANMGTADEPLLVNTLSSEYLYALNEGNAAISYQIDGKEVTEFDLPAGGSVTVSVGILLDGAARAYLNENFENGAYVEGYVVFNGTNSDAYCYYETFTDCTNAWYHEAIDYVVSEGLMKGRSEGVFAPSGNLKRAEAVTVLHRMAGEPAATKTTAFGDVPANAWYMNALNWGVEAGVIKGIGNNYFAPESPITREQIATILWRAEGEQKADADLSSFADGNTVSTYAVDAMKWAVAEGIFVGNTSNKLRPTDSATRAEFATILMRYLGGSYTHESETYANHATFLAFYGDWTAAPVMESADFREFLENMYQLSQDPDADPEATPYDGMEFYTMPSMAYLADLDELLSSNKLVFYPGYNLFSDQPFIEDHIAISTPETDGAYAYANTIYMEPFQLRNASHIIMTVSDAQTGKVYTVEDSPYIPKAMYYQAYGQWVPARGYLWSGLDSNGDYVPSGTRAHIQFDAVLPYSASGDPNGTLVKDVWSYDLTVDYTAPVIESTSFDNETGMLTVTVSDENYLQAILLLNPSSGNVYDYQVYSSEKAGEAFTVSFDVSAFAASGYYEATVAAVDYATNVQMQTIPLTETGIPVTVTLHTPAGDQVFSAKTGDRFTFPGCDYTQEGFEFLLWTRTNRDNILPEETGSLNGIYYEGDNLLLTRDEEFYALYGHGEYVTLEKAHYYATVPTDFNGEWAIIGLDVVESYFDQSNPHALGADGKCVDIAALDDAEIGIYYIEFYTAQEGIRYTFEQTGKDQFTIRNNQTGKYLALRDGKIAFVDTVTNSAKWTVTPHDQYNSAAFIYSTVDPKMVLVFNDYTQQFEIFDDSIPYSGNVYPSRWFTTWLFAVSDREFSADYYTTVLGEVEPPTSYTVTLHTPAGEKLISVSEGFGFTFPDCEEVYEGYQFYGWAVRRVPTAQTVSDVGTVYMAGESTYIYRDWNLYALYAAGEYRQLDTVAYEYAYDLSKVADLSGDWAIVGCNYWDTPFAIGPNGETTDVWGLDGAWVDVKTDAGYQVHTTIHTNDEGIHFVFEKVGEDTYTMKNVGSGKYLALGENMTIAMQDEVTDEAKWLVTVSTSGNDSVQLFNVADPNMTLTFDDSALKFRIFDDRIPADDYGFGIPPHSWYSLFIFGRVTEEFIPSYYTTVISTEKETFTVTLHTPEGTKTETVEDGAEYRFTTPAEQVDGFAFYGWVTEVQEHLESLDGVTVYVPEDAQTGSVKITEDADFYALYAKTDGSTVSYYTTDPVAEAVTYTITLHTPAGTTTETVEEGGRYTFKTPEDADAYKGYQFAAWVPSRVEQASSLSGFYYIPGHASYGFLGAVYQDQEFYALFAKGSMTQDSVSYQSFDPSGVTDFSGLWALTGYVYRNEPYALGANGETVKIDTLEDAVLGSSAFQTENTGIRYLIEKTDDGAYTIQNAETSKYVALGAEQAIAMVENVTDAAKWTITENSYYGDVKILNVSDPKMLLSFNTDVQPYAFEIFDNSEASYGFSWMPQTASEYFQLYLYQCTMGEFVVDYYTTEVNTTEPETHTVTLHAFTETETVTVEDGEKYEFTTPARSYDGHQFYGWVTEPKERVYGLYGLTVYIPGDPDSGSVAITKDTEFYALYAKGHTSDAGEFIVDSYSTDIAYTVTLHGPTGVLERLTATYGEYVTFPEYTGTAFTGYEFVCWATERGDQKASLSDFGYARYEAGERRALYQDYDYYAVFAKGEVKTLDAPHYTVVKAADGMDFSGSFALGYIRSGSQVYVLDNSGATVNAANLPDATATYNDFYVSDPSIRFNIEKVAGEENVYTIQSADTNKYVALGDGLSIAMVETVTDAAKWTITAKSGSYYGDVTVFNYANKDMLLTFDADDSYTLKIYDNTVQIEPAFSWMDPAYPSEYSYFELHLYACTLEEFVVEYYTTEAKLTATLHTPEGVQQTLYANYGEYVTFPDYTGSDYAGYTFICWATEQGDQKDSLSDFGYYRYEAGKRLALYQNYDFYAVFAKGEVKTLDTARYDKLDASTLTDYSGDFALGYLRMSSQVYMLGANGETVNVASLSDASASYDNFSTNDLSIRFTIEKVTGEENVYTIKNAETNKYVALGDGLSIAMVEAVTDEAKWTITAKSGSYYGDVTVFNYANKDMLLTFDADESYTLKIYDNTVQIEPAFSWMDPAYPSEYSYYELHLYPCALEDLVVEYYTTAVPNP